MSVSAEYILLYNVETHWAKTFEPKMFLGIDLPIKRQTIDCKADTTLKEHSHGILGYFERGQKFPLNWRKAENNT